MKVQDQTLVHSIPLLLFSIILISLIPIKKNVFDAFIYSHMFLSSDNLRFVRKGTDFLIGIWDWDRFSMSLYNVCSGLVIIHYKSTVVYLIFFVNLLFSTNLTYIKTRGHILHTLVYRGHAALGIFLYPGQHALCTFLDQGLSALGTTRYLRAGCPWYIFCTQGSMP